jgi:hypothetical protein
VEGAQRYQGWSLSSWLAASMSAYGPWWAWNTQSRGAELGTSNEMDVAAEDSTGSALVKS